LSADAVKSSTKWYGRSGRDTNCSNSSLVSGTTPSRTRPCSCASFSLPLSGSARLLLAAWVASGHATVSRKATAASASATEPRRAILVGECALVVAWKRLEVQQAVGRRGVFHCYPPR
jgi:hypothetical protein